MVLSWSSILANRSLPRSSPAKRARCVLPTNAIHYLTNCTRALGFFGSLRLQIRACAQTLFFTQKSEPKRSMRFTTPSIASAGGSVCACEKYSFPQPDSPSLLLFRRPPPSLRSTFSSGCRGMGEGPRLLDSSSREGDANAHNPKQVPSMSARAIEPFS